MSHRSDFIAFDDQLAKLGVPPLTAWWRDGIGRWLDVYEAGGALELFGCVGRGAAKSTALYRLALFFALFGDFAVPGERHWAICLSRLKEESSKGIGIIAAWLGVLGVPHRTSGDTIELLNQPRGIRIVAASVAATSGWRAFFVGRDERAKWPTSELDEREAEEIDTSATAMTATHARAPQLYFGSAWGAFGSFYDAVTAGSDEHRVVLGPAPSWVAAPHITEESTRKKERVESKWRREYKCEFQESTEESFYPVSLVDRARRAAEGDIPPETGVSYVAAIEPSLGKNAWTLVVVGRREVDGRTKASVVCAREWRAPLGGHFDMGLQLETVAGVVRRYTREVFTDQYHGESLAAIASRLELQVTITVDKPTQSERLERYESVLTRLSDDEIELHQDRRLRADLLSVKRRFTPSGFVVHLPIGGDGRHCDYAPSVILALSRVGAEPSIVEAMARFAEAGGSFFGGPSARPSTPGAHVVSEFRGGSRFDLHGTGPGARTTDRAEVFSLNEVEFHPEASSTFIATVESMMRRGDMWTDRDYLLSPNQEEE